MALRIYKTAIEMIWELRPLMERIRTKDPNLADQLRRAATSVPLNIQEGAYSQGRNMRARYYNALGSAAEVRACLDVGEALGYVDDVDPKLLDIIDRIVATLHRLARYMTERGGARGGPPRSRLRPFARSPTGYRGFPAAVRIVRAMWRSFKGMLPSFKGMWRSFKGMWRSFKGMWRSFKGMRRSFSPGAPTFRRGIRHAKIPCQIFPPTLPTFAPTSPTFAPTSPKLAPCSESSTPNR
jgi:four helix bundle protein